jgi:glycosyltransferase involved in cell wall biosynthesis
MQKPNILYIVPCWPHGKRFGSQLRVLHLARALRQVGNVKLAVADSVGAGIEGMTETSAEFQIECHGRLRETAALSWPKRIYRAIQPRTLTPDGFVVEETLNRCVSQRLEDFDLIWLSSLRMADSFPRWTWPRSVIDVDDLPSRYEESLANNEPNFGKRLRARIRMLKYKRRENLLTERFNLVAVCSDNDREYLSTNRTVHVIPNGFEPPIGEPRRRPTAPPRIGFIGQFGYPPNREGVAWFIKNCWPRVKEQIPDARLRLLGRDTPDQKETGRDIDPLGWIEDPTDEIATWSAMIVPIKFGAGTRVKIAEAFSRKCPVVSTTLGAFGYDVANGRELCLADEPADFANACLKLARDNGEAAAMADRAWQRFLNEWTWEAITPRVCAAAEDCLRRNKNQAAAQ